MLRSMTGFGRKLVTIDDITQEWEIKSVNGRHCEIKWKLPAIVKHLEISLDKQAKSYAKRGRIEISLLLRFPQNGQLSARLDTAMAHALLDNLKSLASKRGDSVDIDYSVLLHLSNLWEIPQLEADCELARQIRDGFEQALADWDKTREIEGVALRQDLSRRITRLEEWTNEILVQAPEIREERLRTMRERLESFLNGAELDEQRFLQEIVIHTDKLDVSEELTRLKAHLARIKELLDSGEDAGRKLDFTLQECFREINTCGNKLLDAQISRIVVDFKNELEKCREQAMNLE